MKKVAISLYVFLSMICVLTRAQSLTAYYPFSGNTLDYSGNNNNGININAVPTTDRFGMANKAYYFGGNAVITIPSGSLQTNNYTFSVWTKITAMPATGIGMALLSIGNSSALGDQNVLLGNQYSTPVLNGFAIGSYTNPSVYPLPPSTAKTSVFPQLNQWYHIVGVRDTLKGKLFLFVDGIKVAQDTLRVLKAGYASPCVATIGARSPGNSQYFTGALDDIRIFNYALSDADVLALYNSDKTATTGLQDNQQMQKSLLNVYPNPSTGTINIVLNSNNPAKLQIMDIQGRVIHSQDVLTNSATIQNIPQGIYFCRVDDGMNNYEIVKFVVTK